MNFHQFTHRVAWSAEDSAYVALCAEFPSLSWLARTPQAALAGLRRLVAQVVADLRASGEAAEEGVSLNRRVRAKLAA